ncbi:putative serpin-like protein [Argiope bruennichi]|uniref:Putative serpin-like protein n=1 Tax=Argiope bruennichi TaxID=94029 RepID=A0A8T0EL55_ARGBR|nr:putative serpin-like protein [Argiope bruennichi]
MSNFSVLGSFLVFWVAFASAGVISSRDYVSGENFRKLALANNELAFNLHRRLASGSSGNILFSPFSISTVFGMLYYGARGETAEELREVLGYERADLPDELVHSTFNHFLKAVLRNRDSTDRYVFNAANALLVDEQFEMFEEYRRNIRELYRATVQNVDFSSEASKIVEEINDYVREKTNGKIDRVFDELGPSSVFVLLNAVYFKGAFKTQFKQERTRYEVFYNYGLESEARRVPMMHVTSYFPYASFDEFQALELPYEGENISMLVLLPNERDGIHDLEESFTPERLANVQRRLYRTKVDVSLPKFKLQFEKELSPEIEDLGAYQIFRSGADFSGITQSKDVFVSHVFHKARIEVNEEGSEAAAVTEIVAEETSLILEKPRFRADHPFLFAIVEKSRNLILFLGRVNISLFETDAFLQMILYSPDIMAGAAYNMSNFSVFGSFFVFWVAFASAGVISSRNYVSRENFRKLALANNELAFNLHRRLASGTSGNVFFSPFSISTVFGMLYYGARGGTAEELREGLGYERADLPDELVHSTFNYFLRAILKNRYSSYKYAFHAANGLLVDERFEMSEEYRRNVQELYRAAVQNVDFSREAPRIVEEINDYVREKTNGKIYRVFDDLSPSNIFVLLNAVYFKGTFKTQFKQERTRYEVFYNYGLESEARRVPMMHVTSYFQYASFDEFQALELPYKGEDVSLLVLLPNDRYGIHDLEGSFTPERLTNVQRQLYTTEVDVSLPKFKYQFEKELSPYMKALGANQIFRTGADFSGITQSRDMFVSQVFHKAVVVVNEEGSEAAAVTEIDVEETSLNLEKPRFRADHPFLFAIVEKSSNLILFLGRVNSL